MISEERLSDILDYVKKETKIKVTLGNDKRHKVERISTGMPMFDAILGGGVVRRGVLVLHGVESSGKTFIAQKIIASAQEEGLVGALIDVEYSYTREWAEKIGIDTEQLIVHQPSSAEEALDVSISLAQAGVDVLVVDSLAALLPESERDSDIGDWQMGLQARLINKFFRKIPPVNDRAAVILINQHRVDINGRTYTGYTPYTLPGGKGQDYFAQIQVETKRGDFMWNKGDKGKPGKAPTGFNIRAKAGKNKTAVPLRECIVPVFYTGDTDFDSELFDLGLLCGIIKQGGPYYRFGEVKILGREKFIQLMKDDEELKAQIEIKTSDAILVDEFGDGEEQEEVF